jgi:predicted nucleic acid-binding protein
MTWAVLADTGPLYACNDEGDTHPARAVRELRQLAEDGRKVIVPYPILLEAYSLVLFRLGRSAALDWLKEMDVALLMNPIPEDYAGGFSRVRAVGDQRITLVDATLAQLATRLRLEVWTYAHHFDSMRIPVWRG